MSDNFNDRRVVTLKTKDMGLVSVVPTKDGGGIVRHEASGQSQRHADFHTAVQTVREGGPSGDWGTHSGMTMSVNSEMEKGPTRAAKDAALRERRRKRSRGEL